MGRCARLERAMSESRVVTRVGDGVFRVEENGHSHIVHVAGTEGDRWLHWNGHVFHRPFELEVPARARRPSADSHQPLSAPMPATVLKVLVGPGAHVRKGDTLLILEAMKMELPVRSAADGVVRTVLCREGELVQPGAVLAELE
jgi:3-methylcrotonyl-CoA carboxylase alpha subunit